MIAALILVVVVAIIGFWLVAYALVTYFDWRRTAKGPRRRRAQRKDAP